MGCFTSISVQLFNQFLGSSYSPVVHSPSLVQSIRSFSFHNSFKDGTHLFLVDFLLIFSFFYSSNFHFFKVLILSAADFCCFTASSFWKNKNQIRAFRVPIIVDWNLYYYPIVVSYFSLTCHYLQNLPLVSAVYMLYLMFEKMI